MLPQVSCVVSHGAVGGGVAVPGPAVLDCVVVGVVVPPELGAFPPEPDDVVVVGVVVAAWVVDCPTGGCVVAPVTVLVGTVVVVGEVVVGLAVVVVVGVVGVVVVGGVVVPVVSAGSVVVVAGSVVEEVAGGLQCSVVSVPATARLVSRPSPSIRADARAGSSMRFLFTEGVLSRC